jgi:hypothetical protein
MNIEQLLAKSEELYQLKEDSEQLFTKLQKVSPAVLDEWEKVWSPKTNFWPVITLRFLVLKKLQRNEEVNQKVIDELKAAIEKRNISALYSFNETFLNSLRNYKKSNVGMFPQWADPFNILYQLFYTQKEKKETTNALVKLGNEIITKYALENAKIHTVGFDGPQNYGSSRAWAVIIPKEANGPQEAYQILYAAKDGMLEGGFTKGHRLVDDNFQEQKKLYGTWSELVEDIKSYLPKWEQLNSKLDFTFLKDESVLKQVLNKIAPEDLDFYFSLMDTLIKDLGITDEKNIIFSTSRSKLSFQIGKRYCINLKKDGFSFITPNNYVVKNLEKEHLTHSHEAFLYHGATQEDVLQHSAAIATAVKDELDRKANVFKEKPYDNAALRQAIFDKEYRNSLFSFNKVAIIMNTPTNQEMPDLNSPNLILFGPPGTGKTYHTVNEAVNIINPKFYDQHKEAESRKALRDEFNRLLIKNWEDPKGQIAFCTFHQSFAYEDFVEGIKPEPKNGQVFFDIKHGIFKRICELAESNYSAIKVIKEGKLTWSEKYYKKAAFFKMSLGDATKESDNEIYNYCKEHQFISIGSGGNNDFRGLSENQIKDKCENLNCNKSEAIQLNYFIHKLKKNDYVLVSFGNTYLRAIGKIVGDYEYMEDSPIRYNHFRKVEWVFVDEKIPVEEVYDRPFTQNTIYKIDKNGLNKNFFTGKGREETIEQKEDKRYVLIIDEINRGNIANIFGELITLIEKDKRAGQSEELEVVLPYSKTRFKVPPNLYIIGTMNTADRSIEALDTALRRRFSFREMPPVTSLIKDAGKLKPTGIITNPGNGQEIDVVRLVDKINERIEKLIDKDHKIGHSYFMNIQNIAELKAAFKDKVIPLLEEYFFGDFGKIGLVLGNSFVEKVNHTNFDFANFAGYNNDGGIEQDLAERPVYRIKKPNEPGAWDFADVYEKKTSN